MSRLRRRVLLVTIGVLLVLDAGRSLYARIGAATPARLWSPDPSYARAVAWPPGSDLRSDAGTGERIYARHCAVCHGPDGRGNGPAAPSLTPRPRDFTGGIFKLKSTPSDQPPALEDVRDTIRHGMPGSSMPAWEDLVSDADINAVAEHLRSFGALRQWTPALPPTPPPEGDAQAGRALYKDLGCPSCHGPHGRGDGSSAKELKDVWNRPDPPRDLTAPWTFRGGSSAEALYARIANGMSGTPMPGYAEVAEPAQIAAVVAYLRSIARTPPWEAGGGFDGPAQSADIVTRGEYLTHAEMCGLCHTPVDRDGIYLADTHYLAGGMRVEAGAHGVFFSRNLTPDDETGLGRWTTEQIATAIRCGHTPERRLNYWGMPWMVLNALTQDDAIAIANYLKTLRPVRNRIPGPLHYGFIETVVRKAFYPWPALAPERLTYAAGNFGEEAPAAMRRDLPQSILQWTQAGMLALMLGVLVFIRAPASSARRRAPKQLAVVVAFALAGIGLTIERYPAIRMLPAAPIASGFATSIPEPALVGRPAHEAALLRRGRYLYGVASCAFCHNGDGAGGAKLSWLAFGTTWARNLTAHPTGLRNWSDAAILRAMTSGVSRDGRALHWQAMIWDHLSNYSVEDQHALLTYVRALPPIARSSPLPTPPGASDCVPYTFWVRDANTVAGCN